MSLDVYLRCGAKLKKRGSGIFVREHGQTKEISREEWDSRFPGREPVLATRAKEEADVVFEYNITHNVNRMAKEAGIYTEIWRPEEVGITTARQLCEPLRTGLRLLLAEPERFQAFAPANGWGTYAGLIAFVKAYVEACDAHPDASVEVSR